MRFKNCCIFLASIGILSLVVRDTAAAGHGSANKGAVHGPVGGEQGKGGIPQGFGSFPRNEQGVYRAPWNGNHYGDNNRSGFGANGLGYGAWGYSPFYDIYQSGSVPYFALFPPVYYGYAEQLPLAASDEKTPAGPPPQPVRILNPYYFAELNPEKSNSTGSQSARPKGDKYQLENSKAAELPKPPRPFDPDWPF